MTRFILVLAAVLLIVPSGAVAAGTTTDVSATNNTTAGAAAAVDVDLGNRSAAVEERVERAVGDALAATNATTPDVRRQVVTAVEDAAARTNATGEALIPVVQVAVSSTLDQASDEREHVQVNLSETRNAVDGALAGVGDYLQDGVGGDNETTPPTTTASTSTTASTTMTAPTTTASPTTTTTTASSADPAPNASSTETVRLDPRARVTSWRYDRDAEQFVLVVQSDITTRLTLISDEPTDEGSGRGTIARRTLAPGSHTVRFDAGTSDGEAGVVLFTRRSLNQGTYRTLGTGERGSELPFSGTSSPVGWLGGALAAVIASASAAGLLVYSEQGEPREV